MPTPEQLLREIADISRMERGALCRMRTGPRGPYFNHQTWEKGRNVVRYVPKDRVADLRAAIASYRRFQRLTQAYVDLIVRRTRAQSPKLPPHRPASHHP